MAAPGAGKMRVILDTDVNAAALAERVLGENQRMACGGASASPMRATGAGFMIRGIGSLVIV